ncbi:MAG: hypothetical protein ACLU0O_00745 [Collinsella sp.]
MAGLGKVGGMVFGFDAERCRPLSRRARDAGYRLCACGWRAASYRGDDIMLVLIGGDIRPHVVDALQSLVGTIKNECVSEVEASVGLSAIESVESPPVHVDPRGL